MLYATLSRNFLVKQCSTSLFAQGIRYFSTKINFDDLVKKSKVVVFMKGTPKSPMCGFSKLVVQILNLHGVDYDAYDVLSDENLRKGIKEYTSWPTIPQVFINGEFVGGCDILRSMHYDKKLIEELQKAGIKSALSENSSTEQSAEQNMRKT